MTATLASRAGTTHAAETLAQSAWAPTPFPAQVGGQRACLPVLPGPTGPVTYPSAAHRRGVRACARGDLPIRCQPEDHSPPGLVSSSAPWQPRCGKPALVDSETARFHRAPWPVGRRVLPRSLPRARSRRLTRLVSRVRIGVLGGRRGGAVAGAHHHGSRWEGSEGGGCAGGAHQRTVAAATRLPPTTPLPPSLRRSRCDRRRRGVAAQTVGGICIGASRSFSLPCLDVFYVAWTRPPRVAPFPPFARALVAGAAGVPHSGAPLPHPPPPPQWVPSSRLGGGGPPSRTHFVCPSLLPVRLGHQRGATPCGCTPRLSAACRSTLCPSARALVPRIVWAHPRPPPYLCSVRQVWEEPRGGAATESVRWTVGTAYRTALHVCGEGKAGRPRAAPTYRLRGCAVGLLVGVGVWAVRSGLAPLEVGTHPRRAVRLTDTVSRAAAAKSGEGAAHRCRPSCAAVFALAGKRTYTGAVRSPSTVAVAPVRVCVLRVASRGDLAF